MDRLTIPDVKLDAHTTRRTMIDAEAVKERAMEIYWKLKKYEDTWLTPAEVLNMSGEWCAMLSVLNSIGSYDRLMELAKADKEGRAAVLPCTVDAIEVVRCKNCRYRGTIICPMVHETLGNGLNDYSIDNGYCFRGKPKEDKYAAD